MRAAVTYGPGGRCDAVSSRGRGVGRAARSTGVAGARTRHPTRDGPHWCEYKSSLDPGHKPTVLGRCLG